MPCLWSVCVDCGKTAEQIACLRLHHRGSFTSKLWAGRHRGRKFVRSNEPSAQLARVTREGHRCAPSRPFDFFFGTAALTPASGRSTLGGFACPRGPTTAARNPSGSQRFAWREKTCPPGSCKIAVSRNGTTGDSPAKNYFCPAGQRVAGRTSGGGKRPASEGRHTLTSRPGPVPTHFMDVTLMSPSHPRAEAGARAFRWFGREPSHDPASINRHSWIAQKTTGGAQELGPPRSAAAGRASGTVATLTN